MEQSQSKRMTTPRTPGIADSTESVVCYVPYNGEEDLPTIESMIGEELSEPYSVFTYRYFLTNWPFLCFAAMNGAEMIGVIIGKIDTETYQEREIFHGYIGMLVVSGKHRSRGIGSRLSELCIAEMRARECYDVYLETETFNKTSLRVYEKLGFMRRERLRNYYMNHKDAFRLRRYLRSMP